MNLYKNKTIFDSNIFVDLIKLMKPRVMSLVIFTCAVGLLTAPNVVSFQESLLGILFVALGAGAVSYTQNRAHETQIQIAYSVLGV